MQERMVFGVHPVTNILRSDVKVKEILVLSGIKKQKMEGIEKEAAKHDIPIKTIENRKDMDEIAGERNHQGIIAYIKTDINYHKLDEFQDAKLLLMLDKVTDPGNFGAILRSCDQFGVDAVIIPQDRSCDINSTVIKASSGSAFFVPVIRVSNLSQTLKKLQQWGFWSYAAVGEDGDKLPKTDFSEKTLLIMGSEGKGIAQKLLEKSDFKVTIPTQGHIDSLNVSVATGIMLYQASISLNAKEKQ